MAMLDTCDKIIIRDLRIKMSIGIYEHEKSRLQTVIINVTLNVSTNHNAPLEDIEEVVSYEDIIKEIEKLADNRHYNLVERFAEDIADMCLKHARKIQSVDVRIEKPDIIENTASVGVQIIRNKQRF